MYPVGCQFKTEKIYRLSSESAGLELSSVLENCPAFGTLWTGSDRIGSDRIGSRGGEGSSKKSPQPRLVPSRGNVWMSQMGQGHWPRGGREEGSKLLAQASLLLTTVLASLVGSLAST